MNSEPERRIRFQFWLNDHDGNRTLFNEWSDGEIDEATLMLPDRVVDLQHWDTQSGVILNHLVDAGWQVGTMPYGVDDDPIPELLPDHETLCEPSGAPFAKGQDFPRLRQNNRRKRRQGLANRRPIPGTRQGPKERRAHLWRG